MARNGNGAHTLRIKFNPNQTTTSKDQTHSQSAPPAAQATAAYPNNTRPTPQATDVPASDDPVAVGAPPNEIPIPTQNEPSNLHARFFATNSLTVDPTPRTSEQRISPALKPIPTHQHNSRDSRGPVSADVTPPPELTDNLRHHESNVSESQKGGNAHPSEDANAHHVTIPTSFTDCCRPGDPGGSINWPTYQISKGSHGSSDRTDKGVKTYSRKDIEGNRTDKGHTTYSRLKEENNTPKSETHKVHDLNPGATIFHPNRITPFSNPPFVEPQDNALDSSSISSSSQMEARPTRNKTTIAIQWNMNGYFHNLHDLEILTNQHLPIALAVQEIHRADPASMNRTLSGKYDWICTRNANIYHSVALGILHTTPRSTIPIDSDLPAVAARIQLPFPLSVVCIYLPCQEISDLKNKLQSLLDQIPEPRLVLGDINGHHYAWGSRKTNTRGSIIMEQADSNNLIILNDGTTTFSRSNTESAIDVSLASRQIINRLLWNNLADQMGSDHHPILININDIPQNISRRPRWQYDIADWPQYTAYTDEIMRNRKVNNMQEFTEIILVAANNYIPKTSARVGQKALYWWSTTVKAAVKARRKALRAAKRLPENHPDKETATTTYRNCRNECRTIIRNAKKESWEKFLDEIDDKQTPAELWRKVNALNGKRRYSGMAIKIHDTISEDPNVIANTLAEYFSNLSAISEYEPTFIQSVCAAGDSIDQTVIPHDTNNSDINRPFSMAELNFALSRCNGKSAGPDNIGYPMLKHLSLRGKVTLLQIFNRIWLQNSFPEKWKHSFVVPIPKAGAASTDPAGYRPISLTSCTCKTLERMVNRRLTLFLDNHHLLDNRQHAFRPGSGTGSYFADLGQIIDTVKRKKKRMDIVSLDIAKAYNRAWTPGAFQQLVNWGLAGNILYFIKN